MLSVTTLPRAPSNAQKITDIPEHDRIRVWEPRFPDSAMQQLAIASHDGSCVEVFYTRWQQRYPIIFKRFFYQGPQNLGTNAAWLNAVGCQLK